MRILERTKATAPLAEYARRVKKEPVILTVGKKPVAALISLENLDLETVTLSTHPKFLALIERSRARQKSEGGITGSEMRRRLGIKPKG
jgi:antitoxin (DNA-binding transcriptional repressor) of toxin-antitoxin stability system